MGCSTSVRAIYDNVNIGPHELGIIDHKLLRIEGINKYWIVVKQGKELHLWNGRYIKKEEKRILKAHINKVLKEKGANIVVIWFS